jgi:hypothetical protein
MLSMVVGAQNNKAKSAATQKTKKIYNPFYSRTSKEKLILPDAEWKKYCRLNSTKSHATPKPNARLPENTGIQTPKAPIIARPAETSFSLRRQILEQLRLAELL